MGELEPERSATEIRRLVGEIVADTPSAEAAWQVLRGLGADVAPYLLEAYPTARRWQARTALVFHAIRFARVSDAAYALGTGHSRTSLTWCATGRAWCSRMLCGSMLSPPLQVLLNHPDARTREDAARALDAIHHQNHHYFVDRQHSGRSFWVVNETDKPRG